MKRKKAARSEFDFEIEATKTTNETLYVYFQSGAAGFLVYFNLPA
jgi:hypothetical protein